MDTSDLPVPDVEADFQRYPLPRLLFYLHNKGLVGGLVVMPPDTQQVTVYFRGGIPVYVDVHWPEDVLGRILLERGWINDTQYNTSLQQLAEGKMLHGQILRKMGAIDESQLLEALQIQLGRKLNRVFQYRDAPFALYSREHEHGLDPALSQLRVDPLWAIYHGIRNAFDEAWLEPELDKIRNVELKAHPKLLEQLGRYGLGEEERALVMVILRSPTSIGHINRISNLASLQTKMLVYALWVTEGLEVTGNPASRPVSQPPPLAAETADPAAMGATSAGAAPPTRVPASRPRASTARTRASDDLRIMIARTHAKLDEMNHYEILGLAKDATTDAIRAAYFKLAKLLHPDRILAAGLGEIAEQAADVFRRINEAQTILSTPAAREKYDAGTEEDDGSANEARAALDAEMAFQKGTVLFRKKQYDNAMEQFRLAYQLAPDEGEHLAWIAWTSFRDPKNQEKDIKHITSQLNEAIRLSPKSADCHYFLAEVQLSQDQEARALAGFNKVLEMRPSHVDALRQVRLIHMRREKGGAKKGIFDKLRKR